MTNFVGDDLTLASQARFLSGPESGQINVLVDGKPDVYCLPNTVRNFIVSAKFTNPNTRGMATGTSGFISARMILTPTGWYSTGTRIIPSNYGRVSKWE